MKRFYREVSVAEADGGFQAMLDGRPVRTQGGNAQIVPTCELADLLACEWEQQGEVIDPAAFAHRDRADYTIDHVSDNRAAVVARLLSYAETDTLCYRADPEEPLFRRQQDEWEPVLTSFERRHGVRFERVSGIVHRPQPAATLKVLRAELEGKDAFTLAALEGMASLAASLVVAMEAVKPDSDPEMLWNAAELEERWQAELWGQDAEAVKRAERRRRDFLSAYDFVRAVAR